MLNPIDEISVYWRKTIPWPADEALPACTLKVTAWTIGASAMPHAQYCSHLLAALAPSDAEGTGRYLGPQPDADFEQLSLRDSSIAGEPRVPPKERCLKLDLLFWGAGQFDDDKVRDGLAGFIDSGGPGDLKLVSFIGDLATTSLSRFSPLLATSGCLMIQAVYVGAERTNPHFGRDSIANICRLAWLLARTGPDSRDGYLSLIANKLAGPARLQFHPSFGQSGEQFTSKAVIENAVKFLGSWKAPSLAISLFGTNVTGHLSKAIPESAWNLGLLKWLPITYRRAQKVMTGPAVTEPGVLVVKALDSKGV